MVSMIRVLIADDHQILRHGLRVLLEKDGRIEVIGEAGDGRSAVELARALKPNIVIMDLQMPVLNGIEATRQILARCQDCQVIFLSMSSDPIVVRQAIQAGARAFVLKDAAFDQLLEAIEAVTRGEQFLSPKIVGVVLNDYLIQLGNGPGVQPSVLTPREHEVLQLLAEGRTSKEIAGILEVSVKTVDTHRQNLMAKLELHSIAELTKFAIREGITSVDF